LLSHRKALPKDVKLYFDWANDPLVREQSYKSKFINFETHSQWFETKLNDSLCLMLIFINHQNIIIGQLRIQKTSNNNSLIGISIGSNHRGNGYSKEMLQIGANYFLLDNPDFTINAFIKQTNLSSKYAFEKAGFELKDIVIHEGSNSFHFIKKTP
jgi:RimJ/RimL family protein N-acetyltransferase